MFDETSLSRDPKLTQLIFEPSNLRPVYESENGKKLFEVLASRHAVSALMGAICAAPSKPPVPAVQSLLEDQIGDAAFENPMKQLTGRMIRQIVEELGGRHVRRGVPITVTCRYTKGSIYEFPGFTRRALS